MIHIHFTKTKQFQVTSLSKNGEVLSHSEPLKSKAACWKNIKAQMIDCFYKGRDGIVVQDDTLKEPKMFSLYKNFVGDWEMFPPVNLSPVPAYIPGKNPTRKNKAKAKRG